MKRETKRSIAHGITIVEVAIPVVIALWPTITPVAATECLVLAPKEPAIVSYSAGSACVRVPADWVVEAPLVTTPSTF